MPIGDLLAQITGAPSPTNTPTQMNFPQKRKVDSQPRRVDATHNSPKASLATASSSTLVQGQNGKSPIGDKHAGKISLSASRTPTSSSSAIHMKNGQPTPPPIDGLARPPKKGSFAEIMARGKAVQSTMGQVGKIQHKKIEKIPSKREREEMRVLKGKRLEKNLAPGSKFSKIQPSVSDGKKNARPDGKAAEPVPEKKIKKAALATTGYAGTARPKPGGTAKSSSPIPRKHDRPDRDRDRYRDDRRSSNSARYAYISDEEDEEEEEEEEGYGSDVSSDMEAAAFEVDEEEETAERIARREDAEALREENRLKKEKEEKRRRLAALAKSRR